MIWFLGKFMNNCNHLALFSMLILCFLSSSKVHAEKLKFITLDVAPWAYFDETESKFLGVFPDLIEEVERRTGHDITISLAPLAFERINRELESGRQDCAMIIMGKEREGITTVGETVFDLPMGVIAKKNIDIREYKNLYGIKISVLKPLSDAGKFMSDSSLIKYFDSSYEAGLRKILHGRLDAIAGAIPTIMYLSRKNNMQHMLGEPLVLGTDPIVLQCSKQSKKLRYIKDINKTIADMKNDSSLKKIIKENLWF
jgi:polar amino acid transport system substrate-binding protein